jgi:crossover junction endodeoxyribonuclease RuvC|tara:strand:+ start:2943 stop:3419 length:477 start_codon:yes stop_codon:yes gene_type:complete
MTIIGIDPGASGALCFTNSEKKEIYTHKCHKLISGRRLTVSMALNAYKSKKAIVYIEKVHAMPHDGRSSLFKFGVNYGAWLGILNSVKGINKIVEVSPQKWMKFWENKIGEKLPKIKKDRKNKLKEIASIYTERPATLWNADAVLITMYGMYIEKEEV